MGRSGGPCCLTLLVGTDLGWARRRAPPLPPPKSEQVDFFNRIPAWVADLPTNPGSAQEFPIAPWGGHRNPLHHPRFPANEQEGTTPPTNLRHNVNKV